MLPAVAARLKAAPTPFEMKANLQLVKPVKWGEAPLRNATAFHRWLNEVCRGPWVVYAKRPFAGPRIVLAYLARYTHRTGITAAQVPAVRR